LRIRWGLNARRPGSRLIAIKYVVLIFGAMTALHQVGINVLSLAAGLGIASISLGFAARDVLSNIIAGLFIFWDKPFVIGDLIEASDEYGEVREITLRTTRITTPDGKLVSIPNSVLVNTKIKSYTTEPHLQLKVDAPIDLREDIGKARSIMLSLIEGDERFLKAPLPAVTVTDLGDNSITLRLTVWLQDERKHVAVTAELREAIKRAFDKAGIMMPLQTIEIIRRRYLPNAADDKQD